MSFRCKFQFYLRFRIVDVPVRNNHAAAISLFAVIGALKPKLAGTPGFVSTDAALRGSGREQPCGQMNLGSGQRFRNGAVLLCLKRNRLERRFIDASNVSFHLKLNARFSEAIPDLVQLNIGDGMDAAWRDSFSQKLHG